MINNNLDYTNKIRRIYSWIDGNSQPPFKVIIMPTNRCNLNCFSCPNSFSRAKGVFKKEEEVRDEDWLKLVKEGLNLGAKEWYILGGGEPLLRKHVVISMIKLVKEHNRDYTCEIITNGTLLTKDAAKELVTLGLDKLLVSIDGPNAETHNYLRNAKNAFGIVSKNLKFLKEYKTMIGTEKPIVQMNTVLTNKNYNQIPAIIEFASEHGIKEVALHPLRSYDKMNPKAKKINLSNEQRGILGKNISKSAILAKKLGIHLNKEMLDETEHKNEKNSILKNEQRMKNNKFLSTQCYEPLYSILIDPKGNANYCCPAGDGEEENNVFKTSLKEVWYSRYFNNLRKQIIQNKPTRTCNNCGLLDMTSRLKADMEKYITSLRG